MLWNKGRQRKRHELILLCISLICKCIMMHYSKERYMSSFQPQTSAVQMHQFSHFAVNTGQECWWRFSPLQCSKVRLELLSLSFCTRSPPEPLYRLFVWSKQMAALQGRGSARGYLPLGGFSCLQLLQAFSGGVTWFSLWLYQSHQGAFRSDIATISVHHVLPELFYSNGNVLKRMSQRVISGPVQGIHKCVNGSRVPSLPKDRCACAKLTLQQHSLFSEDEVSFPIHFLIPVTIKQLFSSLDLYTGAGGVK